MTDFQDYFTAQLASVYRKLATYRAARRTTAQVGGNERLDAAHCSTATTTEKTTADTATQAAYEAAKGNSADPRYAGSSADLDDPDTYRPITLLFCDVNIAAKVLVQGMGPVLD